MTEHAEVQTKLTLDDAASEGLKRVREGFESVKDKVVETGHEMLSMAKQAASFALGFQLNSAIDAMKDFGHEVVDTAAHLQEENRELAGVLAMVDKGHSSFESLSAAAGELNEHLERMGMESGNSKDAMLDAFTMIGERSTRSAEQVEDMVGKMADAAKSLPGGITAISGAWRDLEAGFVRPRNALVQLMRQMGVVKGTAKDVAKGLTAMIQGHEQEKVFTLAEEAIKRMAAKTKEMPLTFHQLMQSLGTFRESLFETVGTPIVQALGARFDRLRHYLEQHRAEIEQLARSLGERVGAWVDKAAKMIQQGFEYLRTHSNEIFDALQGGAKALIEAVQFMYEHRHLLLALAAAHAMGGSKGIVGGIGEVAGVLRSLQVAVGAMRMVGAAGTIGAAGGAIGGALAAASPVIAVAAWAEAAHQVSQLSQETGISAGRMLGMGLSFGGKNLFAASDRLQNFNAKLRAFDSQSHATVSELERFIQQMDRTGKAAVRAGDMAQQAFDKAMAAARAGLEEHAKVEHAMNAMQEAGANIFGGGAFGAATGLSRMTAAFREASEANQEEAIRQARGILAANEQLRTALGALGVEDALKRLTELAQGKVSGDSVKLPSINFGPTTMTIKQDFRDQDPDRIAVVMRRDFVKNATSRVGSRLSTPFGI